MQRSFDDLGEALSSVTFVVIDLETTGASPATCAITEVGAVKLRGGTCLGRMQTLVNPGCSIPREIVYLTGITEDMVGPAPLIGAVLPSLLEFIGGAVIVGHNVRFDLGFIQAALRAEGYPMLANRFVDTCALARRLVRDEVPNCQLSTLSVFFRTRTRPTHRALEDAEATGEVLHGLLERAGSLGVLGLDDLLELPTLAGHSQFAKLKLTSALPRTPGVYLFVDTRGTVIYVGKAVNLRRRVRSYFGGDSRKKVGPMLRQMATVDHIVCSSEIEAEVLEIRLIHKLAPTYNQRSNRWRRYVYVKLCLADKFPRLSMTRSSPSDGSFYLGPVSSTRRARMVIDAIESVVPLRRCSRRPDRQPADFPCTPAQLGVAACPCASSVTEEGYRDIIGQLVRGLTNSPEILLEPLARRITVLSVGLRFEEAADYRDRAAALAGVLDRQRQLARLYRAGSVTVSTDEGRFVIHQGRIVSSPGQTSLALAGPQSRQPERLFEPDRLEPDRLEPDRLEPQLVGPTGRTKRQETARLAIQRAVGSQLDDDLARVLEQPPRCEDVDEIACVLRWLDTRSEDIRLLDAPEGLASRLPRLNRFEIGHRMNLEEQLPKLTTA